MPVLLERAKHIAIIAICIVAAWGIWNNARWESSWHQRDAEDQRRATESERQARLQEAANREREQQAAQRAADRERELLQKAQETKARADQLVADYQRGAIRLRQQIHCTASAASKTNAVDAATAFRDAASNCQLPTEIVNDLIYLAADADATAEQLTAAQRQICDYYHAVNGVTLNYEVCKDGKTNHQAPQSATKR